jgi:hypothetical protein
LYREPGASCPAQAHGRQNRRAEAVQAHHGNSANLEANAFAMARGLVHLARGHRGDRWICDGLCAGFVASPSFCPIDLEKARTQGFDGAKGEHFRLSWGIGLDGNSSNLESLWVRL